MQPRFAGSRARLTRVHGHGEKLAITLDAVVLIVGGAVTFIGGLRTLLDVVSPLPSEEPDKD